MLLRKEDNTPMPYVGYLYVWESVSRDNSLSSNSTNSTHGQSSVKNFLHFHILHLGSILRSLVSESEVSGISLSLHCGLDGRDGNNGIEQSDEQKELVHGALQKNVVGIDRLGDGLETVGISGDTDKVGGDESDDGEHGGTAVTELGFTEEGYEGAVGFGEAEGVEFEISSLEVLSSDVAIPNIIQLSGTLGVNGSRGKGRSRCGEGEGGKGGLHGGYL
mmetsp:Transcript_30754/g.52228  ORF Transcript_30754/g.52228 Transcript_30754/m.52228 type:complete len:219 (-) Transcript_30754:43-699(-)